MSFAVTSKKCRRIRPGGDGLMVSLVAKGDVDNNNRVRELALAGGVSCAEVVRQMIDYCLKEAEHV